MASDERGLATKFDPGLKRRDPDGGIGFDLASSKNVKWVTGLGSRTYSSPVIASGRVFIGTNDARLKDSRFERTGGGLLKCFQEETGSLIWQLVVPRLEIDRSLVSRDFDDMNLGICSTPTVDGNRVYVVSNRCEVLCLDVAGLSNGNDGPFQDEAVFSSGSQPVELASHDADIIWRFDMLRGIPNFPHDAANCSVLVHGDFVYSGTSNGVSRGRVVRPDSPSLIVLDKRTGKLVARDNTFITPNVFHGQWSSPSLGTLAGEPLLFYGGGDGICYAFQPRTAASAPRVLKEVWWCDANPARYRAEYRDTYDYWELVRNARRGKRVDGILISPSEIIGTPVFYDNLVYVTIGQDPLHGPGAGALTCIDPTGSGGITTTGRVWQYTGIGRSMSTVSAADGLVYAAETFGKVHCLDAKTGKVHWAFDAGEDIWASTCVADGKVYFGTRRGLTVLAAGPDKRHLADVKLGSAVRTVPAAANGVLYVASGTHLWAIEEKGEMP
jgi:outer membrane protein assembly factor BamB